MNNWVLVKKLFIWFVAQNTGMTDQSIGRGKFAGLLLLLQGLLLILFVVFVGYSDELLPDGENETKTDSKYSGECNLHYDASKIEWKWISVLTTEMSIFLIVLSSSSVFGGLHLMLFAGFGLLLTFLRKYGFSAMGYNFLISALVIEWSTIMQGFFEMRNNKITIGLER